MKEFKGTFYITIDTEMDADIHWKKGRLVSFSSVIEGIPNYLRPIWDKYDICPIYYVSPEVVENDECCSVLKNEIKKGAIIGAHLHSDFIEPQKKDISKVERESYACYDYPNEIEEEKISNLKKMIEKKLDYSPVWYRAARFGADTDTLKSLKKNGFLYDSSFTPTIDWSKKGGPNFSEMPLDKHDIDLGNEGSIVELPVSIYKKRLGFIGRLLPDSWLFYNWLRPTHMTVIEEKFLINRLREMGIRNITMMFHSMEIMINKTPYVRNTFMQKYYLYRLKKTIEYMKKSGYQSYKGENNED